MVYMHLIMDVQQQTLAVYRARAIAVAAFQANQTHKENACRGASQHAKLGTIENGSNIMLVLAGI